jgi:hypothetical protein
MDDLEALASGWLTTTDMNDFAVLACGWLLPDPNAVPVEPNAVNFDTAVITYTLSAVNFPGGDANDVIVAGLPSDGELYDVFSTRRSTLATSAAQSLTSAWSKISGVPYTVKKSGRTLYYYSEDIDPNTDSFTYQLRDQDSGLIGDSATVTLTKTAYAADALCFDRDGTAEIPDANTVEFDAAFTFSFWFRPQARYGTLVSKREPGGAGVEISLRSQNLVVEVWNASGQYGKSLITWYDPSYFTLNEWHFFALTVGSPYPAYNEFTIDCELFGDANELPTPPYSNDANLIIGENYVGQLDKLTWYAALDSFWVACIFIEGRTSYSGFFSPPPLAQFRCQEGTGSTITDTVTGTLTGTLNNVGWQPNNRPRRNKYMMN